MSKKTKKNTKKIVTKRCVVCSKRRVIKKMIETIYKNKNNRLNNSFCYVCDNERCFSEFCSVVTYSERFYEAANDVTDSKKLSDDYIIGNYI